MLDWRLFSCKISARLLCPCDLCLKFPVASIYGLPAIVNCLFYVFAAARFVVALFPVAGPAVWNLLPDDLSDPVVNSEHFLRDLKTHLFTEHHGALDHYGFFTLSCSSN